MGNKTMKDRSCANCTFNTLTADAGKLICTNKQDNNKEVLFTNSNDYCSSHKHFYKKVK